MLCEDLEWSFCVLSKVQRAAYCPTQYYIYRQLREGSISNSRSSKKTNDLFNIYMRIIERADNSIENEVKMMLYSFAEYIFRLIVLDVDTLNKKDFIRIKKELKAKKYVLGTRLDFASKMIRYSYELLGLKNSSFILKIYLRLRTNLLTKDN